MGLSVDDILNKVDQSIKDYEEIHQRSTTTEHAKKCLDCKIIALQRIQIYILLQKSADSESV